MESGEWRVENGEWRMESGEWRIWKALRLCVDVAQGQVAASLGLVADGVFLAEVFGLDDDVRHGRVLWLVVGESLVR